jgi:putative transposase
MLGTYKSRVSNNVGGAKHPPTAPDQVWTMDFTQDTFASGRRFRTLILMDGCTSEALEIEVDTSLPGRCVVRVLEGRKQQGRKPKHMIVDNGTEFTSHDLAIRCFEMLVYRLDCS